MTRTYTLSSIETENSPSRAALLNTSSDQLLEEPASPLQAITPQVF